MMMVVLMVAVESVAVIIEGFFLDYFVNEPSSFAVYSCRKLLADAAEKKITRLI